jgi:hypothetical protein
VTNDNDEVLVRAFVFKADEVVVREDWDTMGLRATAGHSFRVQDLRVPAERAFDILPEAAQVDADIFRYPFWPFAETTLAVNTLGMTQHFLDCCATIFEAKGDEQRASYIQVLRIAGQRLGQLREDFYSVADQSWKELSDMGAVASNTLEGITKQSRKLVWDSRAIVSELFPYCGMAATNTDSDINRVWRDLFTASQHSLLNGL